MKILDSIERYVAYALLGLMMLVVMSATLEVAYVVVTDLFQPPGFFLGSADLFDVFGLFLMVLIGLELMAGVRAYIENHEIHAEIMVLIAITAVTRKVVIMGSSELDSLLLFGIGFLVIALTAGFYLLRKAGKQGT